MPIRLLGLSPELLVDVKKKFNSTIEIPTQELGSIALYVWADQHATQLKKILASVGYYEASVNFFVDEHPVRVTYQVAPGKPVVLAEAQVKIEGDEAAQLMLARIAKKNTQTLGQNVRYAQYETLRKVLLSTALERGYFQAKLTHSELQVNLQKHQAKIVMLMNAGSRYRFGAVEIKQLKPVLSPAFVEKFNPIAKNDYFDTRSLTHLQNNLSESGYFAYTNLASHPDKDTQTVPLSVDVQPLPPTVYTLGVGYGTDTGPRTTLGFQKRYLTESGHRLHAEMQLSEKYTWFVFNYLIPGQRPLLENEQIIASQSIVNIHPYDARETELGVIHQWQEKPWGFSVGIAEHFSRYTTLSDPTSREGHYLMPDARWQYEHLVKELYFKQGYSWIVELTGALKPLVSSQSFAQLQATWNESHPLTEETRYWMRHILGGITVSDPSDLAPSLRYYAGGSDNLRGFDFKSQGPENASGQVTGGRYFWVSQFNLEQHWTGSFGGLVFYDIGNAFDTWRSLNPRQDVGVGLYWQSPVGEVRGFIAVPIHTQTRLFELGVSIGV